MFEIKQLNYACIPDYIRYCDAYPGLIGRDGDLKDVQRPWATEIPGQLLPADSKILDLGGSRCELARELTASHHVMFVDPYDGSGNGPTDPDTYRKKYPKLTISQGLLNGATELRMFDASYRRA